MKKFIVFIILLGIIEISLALYLTEWRHVFWNFVEQKNFHGFKVQIGIFTGVALLFCITTAFASYFTTMCAIKWREVLTKRANTTKNTSNIENFSQRVQQDCMDYPILMLNITLGLGKAATYIIVFSVSLYVNYSLFYLTAIIAYAILSTWIARTIAKPLVSLNYRVQVAEATYRNDLSSLNFSTCLSLMMGMAIKTKHLNYFQTFYGQLSVVLPIMIVAPAYFHGALTLGALMQATGTMGTISDNCSYGIYNFSSINQLLSCRRRLKEISVI